VSKRTKSIYGKLHIYAQYTYHDEARIIGDAVGLRALADAINYAIKFGKVTSDTVFAHDGEGYEVVVENKTTLDDCDPPYAFLISDRDTAYWINRAFDAEAKLYRIKHSIPEPDAPKTQEGKP
jgi:hypothetical protein